MAAKQDPTLMGFASETSSKTTHAKEDAVAEAEASRVEAALKKVGSYLKKGLQWAQSPEGMEYVGRGVDAAYSAFSSANPFVDSMTNGMSSADPTNIGRYVLTNS